MPSPATQENILAESVGMIPDTRQRLSQALEQLQSALVGGWVLRPLPSCGLMWGNGMRPPHHSGPQHTVRKPFFTWLRIKLAMTAHPRSGQRVRRWRQSRHWLEGQGSGGSRGGVEQRGWSRQCVMSRRKASVKRVCGSGVRDGRSLRAPGSGPQGCRTQWDCGRIQTHSCPTGHGRAPPLLRRSGALLLLRVAAAGSRAPARPRRLPLLHPAPHLLLLPEDLHVQLVAVLVDHMLQGGERCGL